jgi:ABC-2 type transport system permease protein
MGQIGREFTKIVFQRRTLIGWGGLLVLPLLAAIAVSVSSGAGPDTNDTDIFAVLLGGVKTNGMLLPLLLMAALATFLIPLLASTVGAQAIAGEAEKGTLRTNLMQPVRRTWLPYLQMGGRQRLHGHRPGGGRHCRRSPIFFGLHPITISSGQTVGMETTLLRVFAAFAYVFVGMMAIVSVALLLSTLTDSSLTAAASALVLVIVMLVLGNLSVFSFLRPYLITSHLDGWSSFLTSPVDWEPVWKGLVNFGVWGAGTFGVALWRFRRKDVSS